MNESNQNLHKALRYRWVVWSIMALSYVVVFFHRLAAGVVREELVRDFGLSASSFGALASMYFYAYMIMQIPVGMLADSLGARITITVGTLLAGAGSAIFGTATSVPMIFLGRFLVGIGVSAVLIPILKIVSQWYRDREFGSMSGLTTFMGSLGGILAQAPLAFLVSAFTWRTTFLAMGVVSLVIGMLCYLLIRNTPQKMGFPPINESHQGEHHTMSWKDLVKTLQEVSASPRVWLSLVVCGGTIGGFLALSGTWGVSYIRETFDLDAQRASQIVSFCVLGSMVGTFAIGYISDRLGLRKAPLLFFCVVFILSWIPLITDLGNALPLWGMSALFFGLGFSGSAFIPAWAITKETCHPKATGTAISLVNTGTFLVTALLTTAMGWVIDFYSSMPLTTQYHKAFLLCFICAFFAVVAGIFLPETRCCNISLELTQERNY